MHGAGGGPRDPPTGRWSQHNRTCPLKGEQDKKAISIDAFCARDEGPAMKQGGGRTANQARVSRSIPAHLLSVSLAPADEQRSAAQPPSFCPEPCRPSSFTARPLWSLPGPPPPSARSQTFLLASSFITARRPRVHLHLSLSRFAQRPSPPPPQHLFSSSSPSPGLDPCTSWPTKDPGETATATLTHLYDPYLQCRLPL